MPSDPRLAELTRWIRALGGFDSGSIRTASADASFRRYFRLRRDDGTSWIAMDAPPGKEDLGTYLRVTALLESCGLHVPGVLASDTQSGFALLEDLGDTHMLTALAQGYDAEKLYAEALDALALLQLKGDAASRQLPPYDRATLLREMQLLPEWYCARHLGLTLTPAETSLMGDTFDFLAAEALRQPQVLVHRDYHSRNLMILPERSPGVIDFQDALRGPVGYDPVSILKDCYVEWPRGQVLEWLRGYRVRLIDGGGRELAGSSDEEFVRWFDLTGLQRHLKVLGIFARLFWRDGKSGYLGDLPRTLSYVQSASRLYPELASFAAFVDERLAPGLDAANARALAAGIPAAVGPA
jgi:aminoglycoside/choline kinase family phosphotransferase